MLHQIKQPKYHDFSSGKIKIIAELELKNSLSRDAAQFMKQKVLS